MRRLFAALALALLLAPAFAAATDHVYSHRFVIEGRLLGSDGLPLPGRDVRFFHEGDEFEEPCPSSPSSPVTDEWGDFRFCFHKHALRTSTRVGVAYGNASVTKPMDTGFRRTVVTLEEPNETGVAPEGWNETYRIAGRAWQPIVTTLDGVQVYGLTVEGVEVNLTITSPAGRRTMQTVTDATGDFDLLVRLGPDEPFANTTLRLEALGRGQPVRLDATSHRTTAPLYVTAGRSGDVQAQFPEAQEAAPRVAPPGGAPPASPGLIAIVLLAFVAVAWLTQRKP